MNVSSHCRRRRHPHFLRIREIAIVICELQFVMKVYSVLVRNIKPDKTLKEQKVVIFQLALDHFII